MTNSEYPHRLLVVGSGFIASELALAADSWGWDVSIVFRNYRNPRLAHLPMHHWPPDASSLSELISRLEITDVVIATGSSFVPEINRDISQATEQHLGSALLVLDALTRVAEPLKGRVLIIGSASEYGRFGETPVAETQVPAPNDAYGVIKLAVLHAGRYFHHTYGIPVIHVRQFNMTGERQGSRFVVPSICHQAAEISWRNPMATAAQIVVGNTEVRRDFLAVDDVVSAYRTLLENGLAGEIYNVCSGLSYSINEIVTMAAQTIGVDLSVQVSGSLVRESDKAQAIVVGDASRLHALGWRPQVALPNLVARMIQAFSAEHGRDAGMNDISVARS